MEDRRFEFGMEIAGRNDFERNLTGATIGCWESQRRGIVIELKLVIIKRGFIYMYTGRRL